MRRFACLIVVLLAGMTAAGSPAQPAALPDLSLAGYLAHLDHLRAAVAQLDERLPAGVTRVLSDVPRAWIVNAAGRRMEISAEWIRRDLTDWRVTPTAATRARIAARIAAVRTDAAAYASPPRDTAAERATLAAILASPEFKGLHGPSWLDRLRQRALQWFIGLLERMLGSSAIPTITNVLVYGLVALVVALAALWTYRALGRIAALDTMAPAPGAEATRVWSAWLDDARAAAAAGRWADAIHFVYWCGIAHLEERGAWRPDRSRTPREYLRLLASSHEHRPALAALTRQVEHVWYGAAPADASRFDDAVAALERLGCPSR